MYLFYTIAYGSFRDFLKYKILVGTNPLKMLIMMLLCRALRSALLFLIYLSPKIRSSLLKRVSVLLTHIWLTVSTITPLWLIKQGLIIIIKGTCYTFLLSKRFIDVFVNLFLWAWERCFPPKPGLPEDKNRNNPKVTAALCQAYLLSKAAKKDKDIKDLSKTPSTSKAVLEENKWRWDETSF